MLVAAALGDGSDADALLDGAGIGKAFAVLSEGSEQARRKYGTSAWQGREQPEVRQGFAASCDVCVEAGDASRQRAKLREQGRDDGDRGLDDGGVGRQTRRCFAPSRVRR
jgi:hypothetical protein